MLGLPVSASAHAHEIDAIIVYVHVLMAVLAVGWGIYFVYVLFRFNRRKNPVANYEGFHSHASTVIEGAVVVAEVVLLLGFSIPFWAKHVDALPERTDVEQVRVVAQQYAWNIHYPGADKMFGRTSPDLVDNQSNPVGLDTSDPAALDDIVNINQLHVPIGRPIQILLSSKDVIHSFFLPQMRVKQDAIPGMQISTWFTPTKTGEWDIACAQLCGNSHYRMKGFLTVQTAEDFDDWISKQETAGAASGDGDEDHDSFWD